jgi:tRNA threonylcarbamoyladenosine biosynthesis protein TsaE
VARTLTGGTVLALYGDLGAGKTVFARGVAHGLGIREAVTSPTFTVVQEYRHNRGVLYHLDMYRIQGAEDALAFGIEDFLFAPEAVTVVEWPERILDLLVRDGRQTTASGPLHEIFFVRRDENTRAVRIPSRLLAPA